MPITLIQQLLLALELLLSLSGSLRSELLLHFSECVRIGDGAGSVEFLVHQEWLRSLRSQVSITYLSLSLACLSSLPASIESAEGLQPLADINGAIFAYFNELEQVDYYLERKHSLA